MNLGRKLLTSLLTVILFSLAASLLSMSETYDFDFYIAVPYICSSVDLFDRLTFVDRSRLLGEQNQIY